LNFPGFHSILPIIYFQFRLKTLPMEQEIIELRQQIASLQTTNSQLILFNSLLLQKLRDAGLEVKPETAVYTTSINPIALNTSIDTTYINPNRQSREAEGDIIYPSGIDIKTETDSLQESGINTSPLSDEINGSGINLLPETNSLSPDGINPETENDKQSPSGINLFRSLVWKRQMV
jgi:hypothetical protein